MNSICDDKELFKKYKEIWEKIRSKIGKEFAKVSKAPEEKFSYKCLSLIKL